MHRIYNYLTKLSFQKGCLILALYEITWAIFGFFYKGLIISELHGSVYYRLVKIVIATLFNVDDNDFISGKWDYLRDYLITIVLNIILFIGVKKRMKRIVAFFLKLFSLNLLLLLVLITTTGIGTIIGAVKYRLGNPLLYYKVISLVLGSVAEDLVRFAPTELFNTLILYSYYKELKETTSIDTVA